MGYENRRCFLPLALVVLLSLILFPLKASAFSGSGSVHAGRKERFQHSFQERRTQDSGTDI